jgi:cytochrome c3-like protein
MFKKLKTVSWPRFPRWGWFRKALSSKALKIAGGAVLLVMVLAGVAASGVTTASQNASYCGGCHVMAPYVASSQDPARLASVHTRAGVTCQQCHPQTPATLLDEIVSNTTGNYPQPLTPVKFSTQACLACHGTYAALEQRTQNMVRNPHYPMQGQLECRVCHKMHADQIYYCGKCHDDVELPKVGWILPPP